MLVRSLLAGKNFALLVSGRFTQIRMLGSVGLFEFALAMSVIRVSSTILASLSPTMIVALGPLGVRRAFVGHAGPLCFRGSPIGFVFVFALPFVRMTITRGRGFFAIILGLLFFFLLWRAEIELVIPS